MDATCSEPTSSIYAERLLSGNKIRVLHIQPSLERDGQLECTLKLISLDEAPVYEALSYVWGTDPPSVAIVCNGKRLTIRPELSYALVRLRLVHATRILWADALCINQDDNQEKSHQVPLMRRIYSQAARVNVWVGHGYEGIIREAFRCCKLIADACKEFSLEHDMDPNNRATHEAVEIPMTIFTPTVSRGLTNLFKRPLFSRVWCIQEIKLAQHALVVWGEQYLPWPEVGLTALWIFNKGMLMDDSKETSGTSLEDVRVGNADTIYKWDPISWSFLETLSEFREFQSTDPRDKVYGLLGLIGSEAEGGSMVPDYEKSAALVFTETALHTINSTKHLLVFAYVKHQPDYDGDDGYRSWAPRWDLAISTVRISHSNVITERSACSGREAQIVDTKGPGGEHLCLTGICHAEVTAFDSIFDIFHDPNSNGLRMYHRVVELYEGIKWNDPMSVKTFHVLARTLTTGFSTANRYLFSLDDQSRFAHYEAFRHYLEWCGDPKTDFDSLSGDALRFHNKVKVLCDGYRFFWTSKEDFGIGPACMREGDIVVVLYGSNAPLVLRPKGDKYLMLGEAYVDSIMNGELVREVEEGKRQEQEFCLI